MKSRQSLLLVSAVLCILLTAGPLAYSRSGMMRPVNITNASTFFFQQDSSKLKQALKDFENKVSQAGKETGEQLAKEALGKKFELPKEVKLDQGILKKIASLFQFRKKSRQKEQDRVMDVINKIGVNDRILNVSNHLDTVSTEIKNLIAGLSIREKEDFDAVLEMIAHLRSDTAYRNDLREILSKLYRDSVKAAHTVTPEEPSNKFISDKEILDVTGNFAPLIEAKKREEDKIKAKREALSALNQLKLNKGEINYQTDTVNKVIKRFTLSIKNRAEVIGLHNYTLNNDFSSYKFGLINTLIYQSLFIQEKNGSFKGLNGWDTASVINRARANNCKVLFSAIMTAPAADISKFLHDPNLQGKLASNIIALIKLRNADGVNIRFNYLSAADKVLFTDFMTRLSDAMAEENPSFQLFLTLPAFDDREAYDIAGLDKVVSRFLIDMTEPATASSTGALAALSGESDNTLENTLSRYTDQGMPGNKTVFILPYYGIKWKVNNKQLLAPYVKALPYNEIRQTYKDMPVYYDAVAGNAIIDAFESFAGDRNRNKQVRIVFDDGSSLEKKYDFILENKLKGVALNALGFDKGYGDLWDMLAYKFALIDTSFLPDSAMLGHTPAADLSWLDKLKRRMTLYWYILQNPCKVCFEDTTNSANNQLLHQYLEDLRIDSLMDAENKTIKDPKEWYKNRFEYVNYKLTGFLFWVTLLLFLLLLTGIIVQVYQIKVHSASWKWKKYGEYILTGMSILFVLFCFTYLFSDDTIPFFGSSPAANTDIAAQVSNGGAMKDVGLCDTVESQTCINMPIQTLMLIILVGMAAGVAITRYLIFPLIRRDDIP